MISYAQNFEDIILSRAFANVDVGFYVDVGAWHPFDDSVTAHFYSEGWRGVNIEPNPMYVRLLREARPRDINLEVAVDRVAGKRHLHLFEGSGCSSFETGLVEDPRLQAHPHSVIEVETVTLSAIFDEYAPEEVHFLKIDCEGAEASALAGLDLARHRPWVVVIEALEPLSRVPSHQRWEPSLVSSGYRFMYFDGLNRFYVPEDRVEQLLPAFSLPPNLFDDFHLASHVKFVNELMHEIGELRDVVAKFSNGEF